MHDCQPRNPIVAAQAASCCSTMSSVVWPAPAPSRATMLRALVAVLASLAQLQPSACWNNGLARTPPKGFATWNIWPFTDGVNRSCSPPTCSPQRWIMSSVNESQCKRWAQALLDTGLVTEGGFEYFVVQEPCFGPRDNETGEITESGEYRRRWPNGMKAFGDWLHQRRMKLGIYTDIGTLTCGRCVGSAGHVRQDMQLFASWGADLIEVDACGGAVDEATWAEYRDAINATGRPMVHSVCAEGMANVWTWGMSVGNMWRVNGDIQDGWLNIVQGLNAAMDIPELQSFSGPGGWNDMVRAKRCQSPCGSRKYRPH
jgi:alpha-galactosidase